MADKNSSASKSSTGKRKYDVQDSDNDGGPDPKKAHSTDWDKALEKKKMRSKSQSEGGKGDEQNPVTRKPTIRFE